MSHHFSRAMSQRMYWHACMLLVLAATFETTVGDDQRPMVHCIDVPQDKTACIRGCKPGYRGSFCNETCPEHCVGACSQDTGYCLTGCKPNWFASNCSKPCSGNCVDNVCDRRSAECIRGCRDGFYGLNCNETCSGNCTDGKCDVYGGCHCKKGVLDKFCYIDCTDNCIGGLCEVDHDGQLKCSQGCKEGRMGLFCIERCPYDCPACDDSCVSRVNKRRNKREIPNKCRERSTCNNGYRGRDCNISCPACLYDTDCNLSCDGGSWGEKCHFICPQHCSEAFSNSLSLCDFESGLCKSGCSQGYFGYKCNRVCPGTCHKNYCYMNNGSCTLGCDPEHWGPFCNNTCGKCKDMKCQQNGSCTCIEGYYGPRCDVECSDRCKGNCRITMNGSHICETECITGFTGVDCQAMCPSDCRSNGCSRENGTCAGSPDTPHNFKALSSTTDSVTLTWTPQYGGGDYTQQFLVAYRVQNTSEDWRSRTFRQLQNNSGIGVVDKLQPKTRYVFRIKSVTVTEIGTSQSPVSKEIYSSTKDIKLQASTSQGLHYTPAYLFHIPFTVIGIFLIIIACIIKRKSKEQADSSNPPQGTIDEQKGLLRHPRTIDEQKGLLNPPQKSIGKQTAITDPPQGNQDKQSDSSVSPQEKIDKQTSSSNCSQGNTDVQTNSSIRPKGTESSIHLDKDSDPSNNGKSENESLKVHLPNKEKNNQQYTEPSRQLYREVTGSRIVERGLIAEECDYLLGPATAVSASIDVETSQSRFGLSNEY